MDEILSMELITHRILAFGIARDIIGDRLLELELADKSSVDDLKLKLLDLYPRFGELLNFSIAVNEEYVRGDLTLEKGDEIAIIPPVSGG